MSIIFNAIFRTIVIITTITIIITIVGIITSVSWRAWVRLWIYACAIVCLWCGCLLSGRVYDSLGVLRVSSV